MEEDLKTLTLEKLNFLQAREQMDESIGKARSLFWQLQSFLNTKNKKAVAKVIQEMKTNPIFQENIP